MSKTYKDDELTPGQKMKRTMIAKLGSEQAYYDYLKVKASRGGQNGSAGKGFAADKKRAARAGRISRRRYDNED